MKLKYSAEEKFQIVTESFTHCVTQGEMRRWHGKYTVQLIKWRDQFILGGKAVLAQRRNSDLRNEEINDLKKTIRNQSLDIDDFKKRSREHKMMVLEDSIDQIPIREISRISGISMSTYYYKPKERHVDRLDPSIKKRIREIASERSTYGYRRVWAILKNHGTRVNLKTVRKVLKDNNLSLPDSQHRARTKSRNLFQLHGPDQMWEIDTTYIPTEIGMTYLMCIKDCLTKEWQGYNYSRSFMARDAIRSVENAVLIAFNGTALEGLTLKTDNGPQYISHEFKIVMKLLGIRLEYIHKHTLEDNRDIESVHNSIKTEYILPNELVYFYDTSNVIRKAFTDYNECRSGLSIDYLPQIEFRRKFLDYLTFKERFEKKEIGVRINE
ncbi:IS3 family transposase [Cuniculiplasma sp. SKW3]|uniref:IS3 family transposase n=1 Tax=Cuniculiplasma sp. SKW3 TaxID=3400170 RepID=UPI003FD028EF